MNPNRTCARIGLVASLALLVGAQAVVRAQERPVPDTYTAVTANMSPAGIEIRADILQWSTDEERAAVIAVLAGAGAEAEDEEAEAESGAEDEAEDDETEDPVAALGELPTLGVVWRSGSAVGHAIKYAHRETAADGSEIVTLVTDKRVGSTSFNPWVADSPAVTTTTPPEYSVIEMRTGEDGQGSMSLAAEVVIDAGANTVALETGQGAPVLTNVMKAPRPYWASD